MLKVKDSKLEEVMVLDILGRLILDSILVVLVLRVKGSKLEEVMVLDILNQLTRGSKLVQEWLVAMLVLDILSRLNLFNLNFNKIKCSNLVK